MWGVIVLILVGLFLFLVEFLLIPGITLAGIAGVGCLIGGIFWAYAGYGNTAGHITLLATLVATFITIAYALRAKTWKRFMLDTNVDGSVAVENIEEMIKIGDSGITISRLSPIGKARINDMVVEAKSTGAFIDQKVEVIVVRHEGTKVIVKPK